jgi:anti-anti-sigma factor
MAATYCEWQFEVDRGPDWLFVRLCPPDGLDREENVADEIWSLMQQHLTHRVVLEMDQVGFLSSNLIGQLIVLLKRVHQTGGVMRLVGLSDDCRRSIELCRLGTPLANYENREQAVLGNRPLQPR